VDTYGENMRKNALDPGRRPRAYFKFRPRGVSRRLPDGRQLTWEACALTVEERVAGGGRTWWCLGCPDAVPAGGDWWCTASLDMLVHCAAHKRDGWNVPASGLLRLARQAAYDEGFDGPWR